MKDVTHVLITHFHIDHGAIAQEMKDKGAKLIILESQREHLNSQKKFIKLPLVFREIRTEDNILLAFKDSRIFLRTLNIFGEIIPTTGHSPDHVTLVLDGGIAFIGDLQPESASPEGSDAFKDWLRLRTMNVSRLYPAHGPCDLPLRSPDSLR